ncbi:hypothetical protein Tco_0603871 [Tanacetum coccineum]
MLGKMNNKQHDTNAPGDWYHLGVETTVTKIETPLLDQTEGRKEGNQAKKLSHPEIQRQRKKKSSSTSKDASQSQHKHSGKSAHAEEPSHTVYDSGVQQDQEFDTGNNDEQPIDKETWISQVTSAKESRTSFYELMDTSFNFSAFILNRLNIKDLTQEILVVPAFKLLKGTCKSLTELEYHLKECSKATTERLNWHNPEGKPEGDFPRLCLQDIEDMLLLLVRKLTNLTIDERSNLKNRTTYTAYSDPIGVIYKDQMNKSRLMHADELHKFSDGTLDDVRSAFNDIAKGIRME